ncbi:MAG TPA: methyltransferase domain-containing protein [Holophagaceae bacterium]|nr:methyltransferase domain-containing protein [Holophagaceae bacterium]
MRICVACRSELGDEISAASWRCGVCGHEPSRSGGFLAFAPDLEAAAPRYPEGYHDQIHALEAGHFWFQARNRMILWAIRRAFPEMRRFLEIGCGTGFVLGAVAEAFPGAEVSGSEISTAGLTHAQRRAPGAALYQMDARRIPFHSAFDLIGAFDVLEHIPEDEAVLEACAQALVPGGGLLLTVPQHPWLWSSVDAFAGHVRRYRRRELEAKLVAAGFEVALSTSFVSLLLPMMALSRALKRGGGPEEPELRAGPMQNALGRAAMGAEFRLMRAGVRLPAGGSLLVAARRRR